jgi:hypothetical protein
MLTYYGLIYPDIHLISKTVMKSYIIRLSNYLQSIELGRYVIN